MDKLSDLVVSENPDNGRVIDALVLVGVNSQDAARAELIRLKARLRATRIVSKQTRDYWADIVEKLDVLSRMEYRERFGFCVDLLKSKNKKRSV